MERRPLVYLEGDLGPLPSGDTLNIPRSFSFSFIESSLVLLIPVYQQMIVVDGIEIQGSVDIEGSICLI